LWKSYPQHRHSSKENQRTTLRQKHINSLSAHTEAKRNNKVTGLLESGKEHMTK
jgi:hypothetical protein